MTISYKGWYVLLGAGVFLLIWFISERLSARNRNDDRNDDP